MFFIGGERGVRTLAPLTRPNSLANCPLHHLGISPYHIIYIIKVRYVKISNFYVVGGEGGIRTHGTLQTHANFQDWCHKPTRPPLHIEDKCPATVFILAFLSAFVNSNFRIFLFYNFIIFIFFLITHKFQILQYLLHIFLSVLHILLFLVSLDKYHLLYL